jgi:hypothetical protein
MKVTGQLHSPSANPREKNCLMKVLRPCSPKCKGVVLNYDGNLLCSKISEVVDDNDDVRNVLVCLILYKFLFKLTE